MPLTFQEQKGNVIASAVAGGAILVFLATVMFLLPDASTIQRGLLRFFLALDAGLFATFFLGGVVLYGTILGNQIGGSGGFVLFILIQFIVDPWGAQAFAADNFSSIARSSEKLKDAQARLSSANLYKGDKNGLPSSSTRAAIAGFQSKRGRPATGYLDDPTYQDLLTDQPNAGSVPPDLKPTEKPAAGTSQPRVQAAPSTDVIAQPYPPSPVEPPTKALPRRPSSQESQPSDRERLGMMPEAGKMMRAAKNAFDLTIVKEGLCSRQTLSFSFPSGDHVTIPGGYLMRGDDSPVIDENITKYMYVEESEFRMLIVYDYIFFSHGPSPFSYRRDLFRRLAKGSFEESSKLYKDMAFEMFSRKFQDRVNLVPTQPNRNQLRSPGLCDLLVAITAAEAEIQYPGLFK